MYERKIRFHKMEDKKPKNGQIVLVEIKPGYRKEMNNIKYVFGHWNEQDNVFELPDNYGPYCLNPERVAGWTYNGKK